jgi:predicted TIM-barrel fold metal-dependent hydrolase
MTITSHPQERTMDLGPVDADNHYYEPLDAFTRHMEKAFVERGVRVARDGRRVLLLVGGKVNRFIPNPTFDPIIEPGCLDLFFRGQIPDDVDRATIQRLEPMGEHPEYQHREDRLRKLDEQGLGAAVLFPTLACGVEESLRHDIEATMASLRSFNRWLEDDWGFDAPLFGAPMISLADPAAAGEEVDRVVARGARLVHLRPAPVPTGDGGGRSLGHKVHDPVWARLAEAGVAAAFHLGDSGYNRFLAGAWGSTDSFQGYGKMDVLSRILVADRAIHDTIASLVVDGVFARHPHLKVASVENGSDWVKLLVKRLEKQANQTPWAFRDDPLDQIREHVWVTPYYEENIAELVELIGAERVLFGSDWPHGESLANPLDFMKELEGLDEATTGRIMRDNALELLGAAVPAGAGPTGRGSRPAGG